MKVFFVVGMPRSATSLVAKGLHDTGVHMGDSLLAANQGNPHGHFEDTEAMAINEALLRSAGGCWDRPPSHDEIRDACPEHHDGAAQLVGRRQSMWGMKDPRLCLTWPLWLPLLTPHDLHVLFVWRHPTEIARSLNRRDRIPIEDGELLARIYRSRMRLLEEAL